MYWYILQIKWDYKQIAQKIRYPKILLLLRGYFMPCVRFIYGKFEEADRLFIVVRVLGYRSGGLGSTPGTTRKKKM
jgi:hypothetical protein